MQPVDLFRQDGVTAYSHDVQVDDDGIAWVSGDGGTRGYRTDGKHFDPLERRYRQATPLEPVPYAGGGLPQVGDATTTTGGFEHNAERPVGRDAPRGDDRYRKRRAAADDRGGLRPGGGGLQQPGPVHDRLAEGQLQRRGVALDAGEPVPAADRRQVEPVRKEGSRPPAARSPRWRTSARRTTSTSRAASSPTRGTARARGSWTSPTRRTRGRSPTGGPTTASCGPPTSQGYIYTADRTRGVDILKLTPGATAAERRARRSSAPALSAQAAALPGPDGVAVQGGPRAPAGSACCRRTRPA